MSTGTRLGLKIVGTTVSADPFGYQPVHAGFESTARAAAATWFVCGFCGRMFAPAARPWKSQPFERLACRAHEWICDQRPGSKETTVPQFDTVQALEAAFGWQLRDLIGSLDVWSAEAATPAGAAACIERRAVLQGELVRLGLPLDTGDVADATTDVETYAELYTQLCDVVERSFQHRPVDPEPGELLNTSGYARAGANRILTLIDEYHTTTGGRRGTVNVKERTTPMKVIYECGGEEPFVRDNATAVPAEGTIVQLPDVDGVFQVHQVELNLRGPVDEYTVHLRDYDSDGDGDGQPVTLEA